MTYCTNHAMSKIVDMANHNVLTAHSVPEFFILFDMALHMLTWTFDPTSDCQSEFDHRHGVLLFENAICSLQFHFHVYGIPK